MKDREKTKDQLTHELAELRQRIAELEELETQHNQVKQARRGNEERYQTILEGIEEGYHKTYLAGNFAILDDSICQIHGYPKEE